MRVAGLSVAAWLQALEEGIEQGSRHNEAIDDMTKRGVVVFNTPGSNANAVKELTLCGMLLASRGIVQGANHVQVTICP